MTDERQKQFCDALRTTHPSRIMCKEAANEIERLAKTNSRLSSALYAVGVSWEIVALTGARNEPSHPAYA